MCAQSVVVDTLLSLSSIQITYKYKQYILTRKRTTICLYICVRRLLILEYNLYKDPDTNVEIL